MKNWIYAALAAFLATGCAPHGGYTLTGEVPEAWEGKPVAETRRLAASESFPDGQWELLLAYPEAGPRAMFTFFLRHA